MESIYNFTEKDLKDKLILKGFLGYSAGQVFGWIYDKKIKDFDLMTNLSKGVRQFFKDNFYFSGFEVIKREKAKDKTEKFLLKLEDGHLIEAVLIPKKERNTLCLSTQVGCKFSCSFCSSSQGGLRRQLLVSEIIEQYLFVESKLGRSKITNIVFMGIGEPMDNFDNVIKAIMILTNKKGFNLGKRKITISTCGLVPQIQKLADLKIGVKLAISLYSADDKIRSKLMPVNKKYPLSELKKSLKYYSDRENYPISFEYVLLGGANTDSASALALADFLRGIKAKVNLIPYNGEDSRYSIPTQEEIKAFSGELKKRGVFFSIRESRGQDIKAACGQLKASYFSASKK